MGMEMKLRNIVLCIAAFTLLAGCSGLTEKKRTEYKRGGAAQMPPLEVPPELTLPESDPRYAIPAATSYSEYAKQVEQPCDAPVPAVKQPGAVEAVSPSPAKLQENNGVKRIILGEPFDRSWRRVGLALDRAHIRVTDKDRSKGLYYVAPVPDKDKKADKDKKKQPDYLVTVRESRDGCDISVADQGGKSDADSARLIDVLLQNLNSENSAGSTPPPSGDRNGSPAR